MQNFNFIYEQIEEVRIDKFLSQELKSEYITRGKVQEIISKNGVLINEQVCYIPKKKIVNGDNISIEISEPEVTKLIAKKIHFDIIFEDDDLLVIDKPIGLTVHPGAGNIDNTLVNALLAYCPNSLSDVGGTERLGIVHRLDKNTSGLMLVAKNNKTHLHLSEQLKTRSLTRIYKALVWGMLNPDHGTISTRITRDPHNRKLMITSKSEGRDAITHYSTEEFFLKGMLSLINCKLETGRTHQIRVHMNHKSHPIFGDPEYGNHKQKLHKLFDAKDTNNELLFNFQRQALHAIQIAFIHPSTEKEMSFETDISEDFENVLDKLRDF